MNILESATRFDVAYDQALTASVQLPITFAEGYPEMFALINQTVDNLKLISETLLKKAYA